MPYGSYGQFMFMATYVNRAGACSIDCLAIRKVLPPQLPTVDALGA